jgi:hypothetical protein
MSEHQLIVFSNASSGQEAAYNTWYDQVHLDEVVAVPGITSAQRFKYTGATTHPENPSPGQYVALYGLDGSPHRTLTGLKAAGLVIPDSITDIRSWVFTPIGSVVRQPAG